MIRVTPNDYLDRRQPSWLDAEMIGHVYYNPHHERVEIQDTRRDIQAAMPAGS